MEVPVLMMSALNTGFLQRVFRFLCIEIVAIFENSQLSNPFPKVDLDVSYKRIHRSILFKIWKKSHMFLRCFGLVE